MKNVKLLLAMLSFAFGIPSAFAAPPSSRLEFSALADQPLLTGADLKHAELSGSGDKTLLLVELESSAAARVKAYTADHIDGRLAVLLDGKPVMVPRIRVPLDGRFEVGPLPHAKAEQLASAINGQH